MNIDLFDFDLPAALIAQRPTPEREQSRLLVWQAPATVIDDYFYHLPAYLRPGDVLVLNNTRVIKARLRGHKDSGGKIEILIEKITGTFSALALIKASKAPKTGTKLIFADGVAAKVLGKENNLFLLEFTPHPLAVILEQSGSVPLPPYISREPDADDGERYQTVFASCPGAVAAPTAGLHFTASMLKAVQQQGVIIAELTLHVGAGTFQPMRAADTRDHIMHAEHYAITPAAAAVINAAKKEGRRICAVGTTALRALESAAADGELKNLRGETRLFITPGFKFQLTDCLLTNFHLPKSTLMMLVAAFTGLKEIKQIYNHAVKEQYRFFSYGDAMFLTRKDKEN